MAENKETKKEEIKKTTEAPAPKKEKVEKPKKAKEPKKEKVEETPKAVTNSDIKPPVKKAGRQWNPKNMVSVMDIPKFKKQAEKNEPKKEK